MTKRDKEIAGKLLVLITAYEANQIEIKKASTYQRKSPKEGYVWYKITYIADNKCVYDGAFEMKIEAEMQLGDNINKFLLNQLATVL
ncbi:hypothetical protein [Pedobacter miscanthi]|uniref:hypothetical protein n=1 Tax=Pedobacter miscanthi TaxID=2259170 RepID=UPI0029304C52|nr:hypothetical protein [Pedobacter miscanthi]